MRERLWQSLPRGLAFAVAATLAVGCAARPQTVYAPERADAWLDGYPAQRVAVPPERPDGDVRVASFGITTMRLDGRVDVDVLHVRMILDNQGDERPWRVDVREQLVHIPGEGRSRPMLVNTDGDLPIIEVPRRQRRVIDLYYPLPGTVRRQADLPRFDLLWEVSTPGRRVAQRTSFDRMRTEPEVQRDVYLVSGWGPHWWYHPYPYGFVHRPVVIIRERPRDVTIRRPPERHPRPRVRDHRR